MKTTILIMVTLLGMGMLMTSCQKDDLASPSELNKEPEAPGENYVPSITADPAITRRGIPAENEPEEDESSVSYLSIFPKRVAKSTQLEFEVLKSSYVSLRIFDSNDKEVAHLLGSLMKKGVHNIEFDASKLPEGVYTARLWARHIEFVEELDKIKYTASDREVAY